MCTSLRVRSFSFVTMPSPALLLPILETECELETATAGEEGGAMWFVAPEPGLTRQSSWEALLGALGRRAEGRGSRMEKLFQPCGGWQCGGRGSGSPWPGGSQPWSCLEAGNGD